MKKKTITHKTNLIASNIMILFDGYTMMDYERIDTMNQR